MPPIRVLIVDDSVLVREILGAERNANRAIEIVGVASSREQALAQIPLLRPNLVTLDLAIPGTDGLALLTEIRKLSPNLPVIVIREFSELLAAEMEDAMWSATDCIAKPSQAADRPTARQQFRDELILKINLLTGAPRPSFSRRIIVSHRSREIDGPIDVIAIGASAGGPEALARVIAEFPADFPVPILIVQHMPAKFVPLLVERLDFLTSLLVLQGRPGKHIGPGQIWIAPGNCHMTVCRRGNQVLLGTNHDPEEHGCRPSVNVLFRSIAETFGANTLAVVLTGMGADGTDGARAIRDAGGEVFVQDQATAAVWGMPGRVVDAGLADRICPLGSIAAAITHRIFARRRLPESELFAVK